MFYNFIHENLMYFVVLHKFKLSILFKKYYEITTGLDQSNDDM